MLVISNSVSKQQIFCFDPDPKHNRIKWHALPKTATNALAKKKKTTYIVNSFRNKICLLEK